MQTQLDRIRPSRERMEERLIYIPGTRFLRTASLGFHAVLADVFWARSVVYFGGHYLTDKDYSWLYRILDATTTLDPKNILAYRFGGMLLAMEQDDVENSIKLLNKGIQNNPEEDWRLYFQLGFNYFYYLDDYDSAAKNLEKASYLPGSPEYLPGLTARMYARAGKEDAALAFLRETYKQYEDERVRKVIGERINTLVAKQHVRLLEDAAEKYREIYGKYPEELMELVRAGLIRELPVPPDGHYAINSKGKVEWVSKLDPSWP